jgi:hypothetical protein
VRLGLLITVLVGAVWLSGCGEAASTRKSFTATAETRLVTPGAQSFEPPGRKIRGSVWKGSFRARPRGTVRIAARALRLSLGSGRFVARLDGVEDHSLGRATNTGIELLTFNHRTTGSVCLSVTYVTTDHGQTYRGSFKTLGGTGRLARVRATGRFTERPNAQNPQQQVSISGRGTGAVGPRKGLPARCRALRSL